MDYDLTQLHIDLDAIAQNYRNISQQAKTKVMAVIKADAYGHGAVPVAKLLQDSCGFFGVSCMAEAQELRQTGISNPILLLGYTPISAFPLAVEDGIRVTIFRYEDAAALSAEATRQNKIAYVHLAVDTGMNRIGFPVNTDSADICAAIARLPGLQIEGLFSHFATADSPELSRTHQQMARFDAFDAMLKARGLQIPIRHLNNSAGLMNFPGKYEMARAGIVLYGMAPSDEMDASPLSLTPAIRWVSRVSHVKNLPAGCEISYGGTYTTTKDTVVATIPVGYADGYRRCLSGSFHVLIRGKKAPILGRICMDQMMVDVTDIPGVQVMDEVTLVGRDGEEVITTEEISQAAHSFHYEFFCTIPQRVPRIYFQGGKPVFRIQHLLSERYRGDL